MKRSILTAAFVLAVSAAATCLPHLALAQVTDLTAQAQQAAAQHNTVRELGILEFQMRTLAPQSSDFGQVSGIYWQSVSQAGAYARAFDFFSALAAEQKTPNPTVLADQASGIGAYFGWLQQNNLMATLGHARIHELDTTARANFDQALRLDPQNFTALFGYATYESYAPKGSAHARQLLDRLNQLRATHPAYPWTMVDQLKTRLQSQS